MYVNLYFIIKEDGGVRFDLDKTIRKFEIETCLLLYRWIKKQFSAQNIKFFPFHEIIYFEKRNHREAFKHELRLNNDNNHFKIGLSRLIEEMISIIKEKNYHFIFLAIPVIQKDHCYLIKFGGS